LYPKKHGHSHELELPIDLNEVEFVCLYLCADVNELLYPQYLFEREERRIQKYVYFCCYMVPLEA
jgi:hypothetical protein